MGTISQGRRVIRVALVSCVKQKLTVPAAAQDLYVSPLFKKSRQWAEQNCDQWYVLSAKYGLVFPSQRIKPYEMTLKSMSTLDRAQWANNVYCMMQEAGILRDNAIFIWLAGNHYKKDLRMLLQSYVQADPMRSLRMGERLKWLGAAKP